jgi:hypothetical protein
MRFKMINLERAKAFNLTILSIQLCIIFNDIELKNELTESQLEKLKAGHDLLAILLDMSRFMKGYNIKELSKFETDDLFLYDYVIHNIEIPDKVKFFEDLNAKMQRLIEKVDVDMEALKSFFHQLHKTLTVYLKGGLNATI